MKRLRSLTDCSVYPLGVDSQDVGGAAVTFLDEALLASVAV